MGIMRVNEPKKKDVVTGTKHLIQLIGRRTFHQSSNTLEILKETWYDVFDIFWHVTLAAFPFTHNISVFFLICIAR